MKDTLNKSVSMVSLNPSVGAVHSQQSFQASELRETVKQLSELYEIPFGDRNKLRLRAENIFHTWSSMGELGVS